MVVISTNYTNKSSRKKYEEQVQRMADDHFLKISLKKLYEWLVEFDKYVEEFENILKN